TDDNQQSDNLALMSGIGTQSAVSDQNGTFSIIGIPAGGARVMANHAERGRSLAVEVPEGSGDPPPVTLELRGFGSITGKVTRQGKPVVNVMVSESSKGGGAQGQFTQTGGDGTYLLSTVPAGEHVLNVIEP